MKQCDPALSDERFVDFMPPAKNQIQQLFFKVSTLPALLKSCHHWMFVPTPGRLSLMGRGENKLVCTGLTCKAYMLPGVPAPTASSMPSILGPSEHREAEDDAPPPAKASDILHQTKMHEGWRISYRSIFPEAMDIKKFKDRLRKQLTGMQAVSDLVPESTRHIPLETRKIVHDKVCEQKRVQQQKLSLYFKGMRSS